MIDKDMLDKLKPIMMDAAKDAARDKVKELVRYSLEQHVEAAVREAFEEHVFPDIKLAVERQKVELVEVVRAAVAVRVEAIAKAVEQFGIEDKMPDYQIKEIVRSVFGLGRY